MFRKENNTRLHAQVLKLPIALFLLVASCLNKNEVVVVTPPESFEITSALSGNRSVTVSWTEAPGATNYTIRRGTTSGNYIDTLSTNATSPYTDSGLTNRVSYYYMVIASNSGGETNATAEAQGTPLCTLGSNWSIVDEYLGSVSGAAGRGVAIDSQGNIYSVGTHVVGAGPHRSAWLVRKSTNQGSTWSTVDSYQYDLNTGSQIAKGIAKDSNDRLYVVGYGEDNSGNEHWVVRKSSDYGVTWAVVDDFQLDATKNSQAKSIAIDSNDNLYVAGLGTRSDSTYATVVRKSTDFGSSWSTVQNYQRSSGFHSNTNRIDVNPYSGVLVLALSLNDALNSNYFSTRTSLDSAATWTNSDEFRLSGGSYGSSFQTIFNSETDWVAFGTSSDSGGLSHLIVRRSTDSGTSWASVLNEEYNGEFYQSVLAPDGFIYSAGYKYNSSTSRGEWKLRKSTPSFDYSSDVDTYPISGSDVIAYGVAQDSDENLYLVGSSSTRLLTRKLTCE